jgi:hypothetical protein
MDPIDPISSGGPAAVPRRGLPPIDRLERISRERDRPGRDAQRRAPRDQEPREQPGQENTANGQHGHIDVRA